MSARVPPPVAIIGAACRLPGEADDLAGLDRLLRGKVDAVTEVPADRWSVEAYAAAQGKAATGQTYSRWGGFVRGIDQFEPEAFGISPREAPSVDPQQRLLLETAWEALEDAGIPHREIAGTRTGVFIGISTFDYLQIQAGAGWKRNVQPFTALGTAHSIAANRLSYCLDARGPSFIVDTACSSSLVALDRAVRSLREGECETALVGGVNVMLVPEVFVSFSAAGMLSPDGRCKAFDAAANGFVRGEGAGMVVLRLAAAAKARGNRVHALVLGTGINQDGRTTGLAMPNREAQVELLRRVYREHGVDPAAVGYVEAHGTGTAIGDRVEAHSLGEVFGTDARRCALRIGSVKTNIGHLEAGSGVAGLLKAVLSLKSRVVYPSLHFRKPNPRIAFEELRLRVATELEPWPEGAPPIAGVNSFGFGGANAHVVLAGAEEGRTRRVGRWNRAYVLPVSARSEAALAELAGRYAEALRREGVEPGGFCRTAALGRTAHAVRALVRGRTREELTAGLERVAGGGVKAAARQRPVVFVYGGQGTQYAGMGLDLMRREALFREMVERCDGLLAGHLGWSVVEELKRRREASRIDETVVAQPALFAVQVGLSALWASWGVKPDAVVGHSVGEVAAAWASGALSLRDACRVVAVRAQSMQAAERGGKMLAAMLDAERAAEYAERFGVEVAAVNAPNQVTLAGGAGEMDALAEELERGGVWRRFLRVSHAFHSRAMDAAEAGLREGLRDLRAGAAAVRFVSTVTGKEVREGELDAGYWWRNVRERVRFGDAARALMRSPAPVFLEVGPHPALGAALAEVARAAQIGAETFASLRRDGESEEVLGQALGALFERGVEVDWTRLLPPAGARVDVPLHPWRRERYWSEDAESAADRMPGAFHRLLGFGRGGAVARWEQSLDARAFPWLSEHRVAGQAVLPAAAYVEMMLAAVGEGAGLGQVRFQRALTVREEEPPLLQVTVSGEEQTVEIHGRRQGAEGSWVRYASAQWQSGVGQRPAGERLEEIRARCAAEVSTEALYGEMAELGLEYRPAFQTLREVWRGDGEALGRLALDERLTGETRGYGWHPALLDGCLQLAYAAAPEEARRGLKLPVRMDAVRVWGWGVAEVWCHFRVREATELMGVGDLRIYDGAGTVLAELAGCVVQRTASAAQAKGATGIRVYETRWEAAPLAGGEAGRGPSRWVILECADGLGRAVAERLSARGVEAVVVRAGEEFDGDGVEGVLCLGARDVGVGWGFEEAARAAVEEPLRVLRGRAVPRVVLVHSGAAGAAGLVGLGRVAANEFRDGRVRVVEFPERYGEGELAGLVEELMGGDGEVESAWRGGERFAPRLVEAQEEAGGAAENCRLQAAGSMDRLEWVAAERRAPGAGEVLIEVEYAAINFRDVLKCVGQYPATRAAELALGDECGGTIVAVGSGVEGWRAGDRVVTCAAGCFRRYVTAPAGTLFRVPEGWETSDAATMPIAFLTAWYALYTVGRLAAGETVLIHAAAGGVGLAAVQLARRAGARILATAGSEAKRDLLRELGCELVMDSRSIAFGREVMEHTGGRGVDVVLNSLAGEALKESVGCLAAYGRFLEIGKRDLFGNSRVGLWPLRNNGSFHAIDLGGVLAERAGTAERLLREVRTALEAGELRPLPMRVWAGSEVREAFRTMSQGKHTGKLLIDVRDPAMEVKGGAAGSGFRGDATYVVTGGLTGFGRETAKWIARRGGRHIALWSRRGPESEEARAAVEELEGLGASAWAVRCDVADRAEVAEAVAAMARDGRPAVRGVFHAAAVIDDAPLAAMEGERLWSVLRAKAQGAWNLHAETSGMELDHFVLFSSVSATVGNPGQANYAAANAMLEGLARCRRESGLAGTAVGWSFVRDTGFAAGRAELVATAARHGFFAARAEEYLKVLEARWGAAAVVAGDFDWERVAGVFPGLGKGLLSGLVNGRGPGEGERRIREALAAAPREERAGMVRAFVLRELGRIVGVGASKIDASRRIADLGVDSLMGIELVSALEDGLPVSVSSAAANPEATVEQLIREVLRQMGYAEAP